MNEMFNSISETEEFDDTSIDSSIFKDASFDTGVGNSGDSYEGPYSDHTSILSWSSNFIKNELYIEEELAFENTDSIYTNNSYLNQDFIKNIKSANSIINKITDINKPMKDIEFLIIHLINQLNLGKLPLIKLNKINLNFNSISSSRKFAITLKLLSMSYELMLNEVIATKRDLYYQDVNLFKNQLTVERGIDKVCKLLNYQSYELNIVASPKGLVAGPISIITRDNSIIKPTYNNQILLVPDISVIQKLETGASRVIIVEKEATFKYLISKNILHLYYPILLVTGKGYPDLATRSFLNKISNLNSLKLEFLVDWDPHGIEIYLCYKYGAKNRKLLNEDLKCKFGTYKGLKYAQLSKNPTNFNQLISLSERDRLKIQSLLSRAEVKCDEEFSLKVELSKQLFLGYKAELEILNYFNISELI